MACGNVNQPSMGGLISVLFEQLQRLHLQRNQSLDMPLIEREREREREREHAFCKTVQLFVPDFLYKLSKGIEIVALPAVHQQQSVQIKTGQISTSQAHSPTQ